MKRIVIAVALAILVALSRPDVALAHGGTDREVASNYRTRITEVPDIDGLDADIIDIDGTVQLTWNGPGELIVFGYENEPYLRFTDSGIETNLRSPATYLNQDRYANVSEPEIADPEAAPLWEQTSDEPSKRWHDHRTHWMSPIPPVQTEDNPDDVYVIFERWEIPISTTRGAATIAGDLAWTPPPPIVSWLPAIILLAIPASVALFSRRGLGIAAALAATGALAFAVDAFAFVIRSPDNLSNRIWTFAYPAVAAMSALRLWVHHRRRTELPPLSMMSAGLVLFLMGGLDRIETLTNSQLFAAGPGWIPRAAVIVSSSLGFALMIRFLTFLVPAALGRPLPAPRNRSPQHGNAPTSIAPTQPA